MGELDAMDKIDAMDEIYARNDIFATLEFSFDTQIIISIEIVG